jgi:hypothetical protein
LRGERTRKTEHDGASRGRDHFEHKMSCDRTSLSQTVRDLDVSTRKGSPIFLKM